MKFKEINEMKETPEQAIDRQVILALDDAFQQTREALNSLDKIVKNNKVEKQLRREVMKDIVQPLEKIRQKILFSKP